MIKIKVPATSANFCIGFDVCGVAFNIYNTFSFEESNENKLIGFLPEFSNGDNLVLKSYEKFFEYFKLDYIPISITLDSVDVPESRGLGSSATCIVAGVLAANEISNSNKSKMELLTVMSQIEGHPDNVAPAFLGGFCASYKKENGEYISVRYNVSDKLHFNVYVPDQHLSTELARGVLPKVYDRNDIISNLSRIIHLPTALENGNFEMLKDILNDTIHEPYRLKLIDHANELKDELNKDNEICIISGSGSTMLGIGDKDFSVNNIYFKETKVKVDLEGAKIYD